MLETEVKRKKRGISNHNPAIDGDRDGRPIESLFSLASILFLVGYFFLNDNLEVVNPVPCFRISNVG
jgi:hypothetical protein